MDPKDDADNLIARIGLLCRPSDLDLLLFFARHPRTLMASEQLAAFLGYGVTEIADSLDRLLGAGLLTRTPNPKHAARMYVFVPGASDAPDPPWLPALLELGSTRDGRLRLLGALRRRPSTGSGQPSGGAPESGSGGPRPSLVRRRQN